MTSSPCTSRTPAPSAAQQGVALVVSLVLLVVVTLLGLSGMRTTTLQERMSANLYDRSLALQAAESALSAAEAMITANPDVGDDCITVACPLMPANTFTGTSNVWFTVPDEAAANRSLYAGAPQFHIQLIGQGTGEDEDFGAKRSANLIQYGSIPTPTQVNYYRVTARSSAPEVDIQGTLVGHRAIVVLQSTIRRNV